MKTFKQYIKTKKKDKLPDVFVGLPRHLSHLDSLLKEEVDTHSKYDLARELDEKSKPNLNDDESKHVREYTGPSSAKINMQLRGERREEPTHTDSIHNISRVIRRHTLHRGGITVYSGLPRSPEEHRDESGELKFENKAFTSTSIHPSVAMRMSGRQSKNTNVDKLREHIENGDHEKAEELLKHNHIYFHHSGDGRHSHEHGEKFDLNDQSHIDTLKLRFASHSGGQWREANHVIQTTLPKGTHALWIGSHLSPRHKREGEILMHYGAQFHVHETEVVSEPDRDKPSFTVVHHATLTHDGVKPTGLKPPRRKGLLSRLLSRKKAA